LAPAASTTEVGPQTLPMSMAPVPRRKRKSRGLDLCGGAGCLAGLVLRSGGLASAPLNCPKVALFGECCLDGAWHHVAL